MAISACFGGPLFNLLLGVGIPFLFLTLKRGGAASVTYTPTEAVLIAGLLASLLSSLLILPIRKFNIGRAYGAFLLLLYASFLTLSVLVEARVVRFSV